MLLPFLCRRERNVPRQGSPPPRWSSLMLDAPVWRSTGPSTVAPAWMAGAARPSRPGLSRSGSAVMTGKPLPRASWWSSPADATTTVHMQMKPTPTTDWSTTFINLGTKLCWGWDAKENSEVPCHGERTFDGSGALPIWGQHQNVTGVHCATGH